MLHSHNCSKKQCAKVEELAPKYTFIKGKDVSEVYRGCSAFRNVIERLHIRPYKADNPELHGIAGFFEKNWRSCGCNPHLPFKSLCYKQYKIQGQWGSKARYTRVAHDDKKRNEWKKPCET